MTTKEKGQARQVWRTNNIVISQNEPDLEFHNLVSHSMRRTREPTIVKKQYRIPISDKELMKTESTICWNLNSQNLGKLLTKLCNDGTKRKDTRKAG